MKRLPFLRRVSSLNLLSLLLLHLHSAEAGSATWNAAPVNGNWFSAPNWTPATIPQATADTATFGSSTTTNITSAVFNVGSVVFQPGASAYTFTPFNPFNYKMSGPGIINDSGVVQNFLLPAVPQFIGDEEVENLWTFAGTATAGSLTQYTLFGSTEADDKTASGGGMSFIEGATAEAANFIVNAGLGSGDNRGEGGVVLFYDTSTAANATFTLAGGTVSLGFPAFVFFQENSTAANASFTVNGGTVAQGVGGNLVFASTSAVGNATVTCNGGGVAGALGGVATLSTLGSATVIANGGVDAGGRIFFVTTAGGTARLEAFGNGQLDVSGGLTTGSIEGDGSVVLGAHNLSVGANNLSTTFTGVISGSGGSLTKTGKPALTLTGANLYTGGTTVTGGTLNVNNTSGSGTGTGPVEVRAGTLGGNGIIAGDVSIGGDPTKIAMLSPGGAQQATLTIQGALTFLSSTYTCTYQGNSQRVQADQVVANGVNLINQPGFNFPGKTRGALRVGTVLKIINNTAATPIAGRFGNLADGAIIAVAGGNFQANYEGGDGNDLTMTVVP